MALTGVCGSGWGHPVQAGEVKMVIKGGALSKLNAFPRAEEHLMQKTTTGAAGTFNITGCGQT